MKLETIKKVVLAAVVLPFFFMVAEGLLLIHHSFQQYGTLRNDREIADVLAKGGSIASTEIPGELDATQSFLAAPGRETEAALDEARAAVDVARQDFFKRLPKRSELDSGLDAELSKLSFGYSRIVGLRSAIDSGRYGPNADVGYIFRQAALKQLGIGDSLSSLIHDPVLLRKSNELMSMLLTYQGEMVVSHLGGHYLSQAGYSALSPDQLVQGDVLRRLGTDRLRFHTSSPVIRDILAFLTSSAEKEADTFTQAILSGALKPTIHVRDSWMVAQQARLTFLRDKIHAVVDDLHQTGTDLALRAHYQMLVVLSLSAALLVLVAIIVGLAGKGIQLVDRLMREREALVKELRSAAQTDLLTGLYNRRGFEVASSALMAQALSGSRWISLVLFDLDHFKKVNDVHGHDVGDVVLRQVAAIARENFRAFDLLVRHGGEEFMALLPDSTPEEAAGVAERVRQAVEAAQIELPNGGALKVTASFGCAGRTHSAKGSNFEDLIKRADLALYAAKAAGRNQVAGSAAMSYPVEERRRSKPF
jgi:diguanylate cyclase (GGDEF)-like protein